MSNAKELGKQEHSDSDSGGRATTENAVEERQAEAPQQQTTSTTDNSLEKYCEENPGASQCRIYEE